MSYSLHLARHKQQFAAHIPTSGIGEEICSVACCRSRAYRSQPHLHFYTQVFTAVAPLRTVGHLGRLPVRLLYLFTGSIWGSIATHAIVNALGVIWIKRLA